MKRKKKTFIGLLGPRQIVQEVTTAVNTLVACPLCKTRFKNDDVTILIDLVTRIQLTGPEEDRAECTVRLHICEACAEPIKVHRQNASKPLISLLARQFVQDAMKEAAAKMDERSSKPEKILSRKPKADQR